MIIFTLYHVFVLNAIFSNKLLTLSLPNSSRQCYSGGMNERYELLHDSKAIQQRLGQLASEITAKYDGEDPLFVALLNGAAPFATDLMKTITKQAPDFHPELAWMMTSRYPDTEVPNDITRIVMDIPEDVEVKNRDVVVIDDVLDMGETAKTVREHLLGMGARYVALAVLIEKDVNRTSGVQADYVGFRGDQGWLVGYGMNDNTVAPEAYRWSDGVWRITPTDRPDIPPQLALV